MKANERGRDGTSVPSTKTTQKLFYRKWSAEDIEALQAHPDMTAQELAELLGRSEYSVRHMRSRVGRWKAAGDLCVSCGERVVWAQSPHAKQLHLCKGCYVREEELRVKEELANMRIRQTKTSTRKVNDGKA